jgi:hypothetical protein
MRMRLSAVLTVVLSACGSTGPAVMEFVEVSPAQPRIGDVATVRFRLLDSRGVPLAGTNVEFKLQSANTGVTLSPTSAPSIRGSGYAETQIVASSRVNSVIIVATAGDKSIQSPPITFAGTVPNGRQFTFQCGSIAGEGAGGRHALGAYDMTRTLIAGSVLPCTAHVGDRNGDGVKDALVSFLTEAGAVGPSDVSQANLVGDATILHKTSLPLPVELTPDIFSWTPPADDPRNTGEYRAPLWMHPFNWTQNPLNLTTNYTFQEPRRPDPIRRMNGQPMENNPRDNLVSMIAVTSGEEGFDDTNNNGKHDATEEFDDLTEPFVDSNDNGTWDSFERFIDVNGNREWDGKNGEWDANTLIWRQERIIWTGIPATEDTLSVVPGVNGHKPIFAAACPSGQTCTNGIPPAIALTCPVGTTFCAAAGPPVEVRAYLADPWFNALAKNGDADGCRIEAQDMSPVKVSSAETIAGFAFTYPPGEHLRFTITDARDPLAPPINQAPIRRPAIDFVASIVCTYTASPQDGYVIKISAGTIKGTIE